MWNSPGMDTLYFKETSDHPDYVIPQGELRNLEIPFVDGLMSQIKIFMD